MNAKCRKYLIDKNMGLVNKANAMMEEMGTLKALESKEYAKIWHQVEILNEILAETDPYPIKSSSF